MSQTKASKKLFYSSPLPSRRKKSLKAITFLPTTPKSVPVKISQIFNPSKTFLREQSFILPSAKSLPASVSTDRSQTITRSVQPKTTIKKTLSSLSSSDSDQYSKTSSSDSDQYSKEFFKKYYSNLEVPTKSRSRLTAEPSPDTQDNASQTFIRSIRSKFKTNKKSSKLTPRTSSSISKQTNNLKKFESKIKKGNKPSWELKLLTMDPSTKKIHDKFKRPSKYLTRKTVSLSDRFWKTPKFKRKVLSLPSKNFFTSNKPKYSSKLFSKPNSLPIETKRIFVRKPLSLQNVHGSTNKKEINPPSKFKILSFTKNNKKESKSLSRKPIKNKMITLIKPKSSKITKRNIKTNILSNESRTISNREKKIQNKSCYLKIIPFDFNRNKYDDYEIE